MTPQTCQQTIVIDIFLIISRSKGNQTMKFGQFIKYENRYVLFKSYAENEAERLERTLLVFKKALYEVKASGV